MNFRLPRAWTQRRDTLARLVDGGHTAAFAQLSMLSEDADGALSRGELDGSQWSSLKFSCSSLLINLGDARGHREALSTGIDCARETLDRGLFPEIAAQLKYNIANGLSALHELDRATWRTAEPALAFGILELRDRERLRTARSLFAAAGYSTEPSDLRGRALCNLGNTLDHSGRWLEAYQCYVDALDADPTNGNAAGNAAELLRRRAARGQGFSGHYAAVYDVYRERAQHHRARTVELAGEAVARRWDALPPSGSQGHVSHEGDPLDQYQKWIKEYRLALTAAVEGLGSDEPRWDSALVEEVRIRAGEPDPPLIFTSMNVLKAEFLAARRLAYEGERRLTESLYAQHPTDTGTYADTLDMAVYGEPSAQLILAQRATLDLLDKIAVAANDHFGSEIDPTRVSFASYWRARGSSDLRRALPVPNELPSAAVALAELAFDMDPEGLYPNAKILRNAGTHRLVHITHGTPTGPTQLAHSSVDAGELVRATHQSLRVARAAYIYLIDLVRDQQDSIADDRSRIALQLPTQP